MSKTKTAKKKTTGFDIMYRVVVAILVIAMFPVSYFSTMVYYEIEHTEASAIISKLTGKDDPGYTYGEISLQDLADPDSLYRGLAGDDTDVSAIFSNELYRPVIVAAALFVVALILGLVILGFAAFSNKVKVITGLSAGGFLVMVASYISFSKFFAAPILSGETTLAQLFNKDGSLAMTLLGLVGKVSQFHLDTAFFAVMFLMLGVFIWSISVMIVNRSDEKEKKEKALKA